MAEIREVVVPDIGDFADVPVIEVLVAPGDTRRRRGPARHAGVGQGDDGRPGAVRRHGGADLRSSVGDTVSEGSPLLTLQVRANGEPAQAPAAGPAAEPALAPCGRPSRPQSAASGALVGNRAGVASGTVVHRRGRAAPPYASPAVRRLARELGVDLSGVKGSGRKGRITKEDVRGGRRTARGSAAAGAAGAAVAGLETSPPWPKVDFEKFGPGRAPAAVAHPRRSPARTCRATGR